ncbi:flammutoxin-like protein [Pleurotus ostreatus PC15]|uniref:Flammutoxin-like protein n=1 Tax=Pleurotus ostreatus (strain PC15) TaxID=1137138 RepID=A0A067NHA5_PLEO1|nr:flammutoxin-like protein [Pleurotus ostreatus PC15]
MARFKTTWEDLAHLGYSRLDVWSALNKQRGGTMRGPLDGGVALNEGIALQWAWYCYNDFKGPAAPKEPVYRTVSADEVLWEYNNTTKDHVKGKWSGSWKSTEHISATITRNAGIRISGGFDVPNAFDRGVDFRLSQDEQTKVHEDVVNFSHDWSVVVEPGQHLRLIRKKTTMSGTQEFQVPYGLANTPEDRIATNGRPWNEYLILPYSLNATCDTPSKVMLITCILRKEEYVHVLQDIAANDVVSETPLFVEEPGCIQGH